MPAPLVTAAVNSVGRTIFRKAGRFISKQDFLRESRRAAGGQFVSKLKHARGLSQTNLAELLQNKFGSPIDGGSWGAKIRKSAERFIDVAADANQLG